MSLLTIGAKITADTGAFVSGMAQGSRGLQAFAGAAGLATGALGAFAGVQAVGAAIRKTREYQAELIKLNTLVGISVDELEGFDRAFREISSVTGTSASDVARAGFAITSGGARGAEAIEAIEQAAKLAAIGLGDMQTIGRTLTAALQTFGSTGLTASTAADTLAATVREGNLEASELAGALSRVLGPAQALGVSFQDVGAFMATFTRLGGDSAQAATGLLNVFNLLIAPPKKAREAMEQYGVSVERLRQIAGEQGLQQALEALSTALGGNIDKLGETVPNVRASNAVLATAVVQAEEYARIQEDVRDATGTAAQAFATYSETADAKFARFGSAIEGLGLAIGSALLPSLALMITGLQTALTPFTALIEHFNELAAILARDIDGPLQDFVDWLHGVEPNLDSATQSLYDYNQELAKLGREPVDITPYQQLQKELSELSEQELTTKVEELRQKIRDLTPETEGATFAAIAARLAQKELAEELVQVNAHLQRRTARTNAQAEAERQLTEEQERAQAAIRTQLEQQRDAERQNAIDELLGSLLQEVELLEQGERAMLANQLETLQATDAEREQALARYDNIQAIEAEAEAVKQAEAVRARLRRERLANRIAERERAEDRRQKLRQKLEEQEEKRIQAEQRMAQLAEQNRLRDISAAAGDMADAFADAFGSIIKDISNTEQAFKDLLATIARQVQRQAITRLITEPLTDAIVGIFDGGPVDTADIMLAPAAIPTGKDLTGNNKLTTSSGMSSLRVDPVQSPSSLAVNTGTGQMQTVVQQTINFAPSFIDGADGEAWLRSNSQEIMTIISDGARRSSSYATALRG